MKNLAILFVLTIITLQLRADDVSGEITTDTTWSGEITVIGDITVNLQ